MSMSFKTLKYPVLITKRNFLMASTVTVAATADAALVDKEVGLNLEDLSTVVLSGFSSKQNNFADSFVASKLFEKNTWKDIVIATDDIAFAKKRMVTPNAVYSGLIDAIQYTCLNEAQLDEDPNLETSLKGKDAWICFDVPFDKVQLFASIAAKNCIKRLVLAVNCSANSEYRGENVTFDSAVEILKEAGVVYTLIKFSKLQTSGESKVPFRVLPGKSAFSSDTMTPPANQDLFRIMTEVVDLPKTFNGIYSLGSGSKLDSEILMYMKSQGYSERVQVGLVMGDLMERLQVKYDLEKQPKPKLPISVA